MTILKEKNTTICNIYSKFQSCHFNAEYLKMERSETRLLKEQTEEGLVSLLATDLKTGLNHEQKELCLRFGYEGEEQSLYSGHVLTQHHITQLGFNPGATIRPFKTPSLYLTDGACASMIQTR